MGIVEVTPSSLAPSVGIWGAGTEASSAPSASIGNSPIRVDSIRFGSVDFTKHSPASSPAFSCINGSMDLTFGDFNFRATRTGILRLQNSNRSPATRPTEPEKLAIWADDDDEIGSEPDSSTPPHPHLHFIGMVKRVPRENSDGEMEEEDDPSKSEPKSWAQMDAGL